MKIYIAQATTSPQIEPPVRAVTPDASIFSGNILTGVGLLAIASVQIFLKVWEKNQIVRTDSQVVKEGAKIEQGKEALTTLIGVFEQEQKANIDLQTKTFDANSHLITQLMDIRTSASNQYHENLMARLDEHGKAIIDLANSYKQLNITIVDLCEAIKAMDLRADNDSEPTD